MTMDQNDTTPTAAGPWLQVQGSRHFLDWLAEAAVIRNVFAAILARIARLAIPPPVVGRKRA